MTIEELKAAYEFGKDAIKEYKERNEKVPEFIYDRMLELSDQLVDSLMIKLDEL